METEFYDQTFEKIDFSNTPLGKQYEQCTFTNCNFENQNLSGIIFMESTFKNCNLSLVNISKTAFKDVQFIDCKIMGARFDNCDPFLFEIYGEGTVFNLSVFYRLKMQKTIFNNCSLKEVDFSETDLSGSKFINTDLLGATFDRTNLQKADLRGAYNFSIDPESAMLNQARFSKESLAGLLTKYALKIE